MFAKMVEYARAQPTSHTVETKQQLNPVCVQPTEAASNKYY